MGIGFPSKYFDYGGAPIFAYNYKDLVKLVAKIEKNNYLRNKNYKQLQKDYYSNKYDGKIKERLHSSLKKIYDSC